MAGESRAGAPLKRPPVPVDAGWDGGSAEDVRRSPLSGEEQGAEPARPPESFAIPWSGSPLQKISDVAGAEDAEEIAIAARAARAAIADSRTGATPILAVSGSGPSMSMQWLGVGAPFVAAVAALILVVNIVRPSGGLDAERLSARLASSVFKLQVWNASGSGFVLDSTRSWTLSSITNMSLLPFPWGWVLMVLAFRRFVSSARRARLLRGCSGQIPITISRS